MKLDVIISASRVTAEQVADRTVCVIDVFRATSVMITAMKNGADHMVPLLDIPETFAFRDRLGPQQNVILGGERGTVLIPGFDLDNSPLAYTSERVAGATILFTTTNGTRAINGARAAGAGTILIGALINATAVCRRMMESGRDITLICSGREGHYTMEDALCAGLMAEIVSGTTDCFLTDLAWTLRDQYRRYKNDLRDPLSQSQHYNFIMKRGLLEDIAYCLQIDITDCVPQVNAVGEVVLPGA